MQILFEDKRLQELINNTSKLTQKFGDRVAKKIIRKLTQLQAFENLSQVPTVPPYSRHNLDNEYDGCVGIDVIGRADSNRIVLKPIDEEGNQISVERYKEATRVVVVFVGNYH